MKRRQRKPILDLNGEQADLRRRWQNKYEQIADEHPEQNGSTKNPLFNLVGQYDSDSETDDKQLSANVLNDKVDDFLKEIQSINPDKTSAADQPDGSNKNPNYKQTSATKSAWQECFDETTGYPYYWHVETNEVTWELPEELRKKNAPQNEALSHNHFMHWSASSVTNYPQIQNNIPEGMIPKEVVARNRNRQIGNHQKVVPDSQPTSTKSSYCSKDEDSDDGKIEMITSFGNDESDSDETSDESINKSPEKISKRKEKSKLKRISPSRKEAVQMGPENLLPMVHGPENSQQNRDKSRKKEAENRISLNEKSQVRLNKQEETNESRNTTEEGKESKLSKEIKVSLVPGYEDDSDNEEEVSHKQGSKPLFPISNFYAENSESANPNSRNEIVSADKTVKKVETDGGCIRIFEYHANDTNLPDNNSSDKSNEGADDTPKTEEEQKSEQDAKTNKFLDDIDAPIKAFQRKKRIAFDVNPSKPKSEPQESSELPAATYTTAYENEEKYGLGFQDKNNEDSSKPKEVASSMGKNSISFIKGETMNNQKEEEPGMSEEKKAEFKILTDTITEKLKFLSEGSPSVSAVQVMAIQLQTLLSAWESKDLKEKYLCDWLTETSRELSRLEQTAAPPGWECQWDRSHKRYFYRNLSNGEMQWTYPQTDVVGGTEEMELCTTPPPDQEESEVIEVNNSNAEPVQEEGQAKSSEVQPQPILAPPPPQISSPSPPPPPKICAEDLKRGKKRKGEQDKPFDNKKDKLDQGDLAAAAIKPPESQPTLTNATAKAVGLSTTEPLPPGVDSPDLSYTLPNSAIDSTVLYTAASQQSNPIYAATLGNTVPLLAHHTALIQGQLVHYPAYHPLHNQMIMATANRLAEQDTIQFMVPDYARIYESNQVIAKPPVKTTQNESICSAIDSFYNDIATIEQKNKLENELGKKNSTETVPSSAIQVQPTEAATSPAPFDSKEKKKKKAKVGISKKQKEVSSMVAKWQKVQKNFID